MHESQQYNITLHWDEQQHTYIAEADDLPGVTGKGNTRENAIAAVEDAIRWWLESATEGTQPSQAQEGPKDQPSH